ncbi:MAG: hypothetical protein KJP16_04685 [Gammaproteobacteria bacterium]|nr:hypothetical protein [Gammaproteobacteria bacterium]NNL50092.1 hypothetical protein [Woeseiaceae bacterium]
MKGQKLKIACSVVFASILLNGTIPVGYMPGNLRDGTWAEFCPDGLSADFIEALTGEHGGHNAHHESDGPSFADCDLGGIAGTDVVIDAPAGDASPNTAASKAALAPRLVHFAPRYSNYRPRSPPISRSKA